MAELTFAFVREGTSDDGLVNHIRTLLLQAGASAVIGASRSYKGTTLERLQRVWAEDEAVDLIFVHRDSDDRDPTPRHDEINTAAAHEVSWGGQVVPVVPVQELEAWLLADHDAIRSVSGKPHGKASLDLPPIRNIETTTDPKKALLAACLAASETSGARYKREKRDFPKRRAALLERMDLSGPVRQLPSWQRFLTDLDTAAKVVLASK